MDCSQAAFLFIQVALSHIAWVCDESVKMLVVFNRISGVKRIIILYYEQLITFLAHVVGPIKYVSVCCLLPAGQGRFGGKDAEDCIVKLIGLSLDLERLHVSPSLLQTIERGGEVGHASQAFLVRVGE